MQLVFLLLLLIISLSASAQDAPPSNPAQDQLEHTLGKLVIGNMDLNAQLAAARSMAAKAQAELNSIRSDNVKLQAEISKVKNENVGLQTEIDGLKKAAPE